MKKAVFLDRDGVVNKTLLKMGKQRAPYTLEEFAFVPGVEEACQRLKDHGYLLVVVTNQPDVQRGWVSREQVDFINGYVQTHLPVDEVMACFHTSADGCDCRKPKPGMLLEATRRWQIDLASSFMVGDRPSDIEAGFAAGCRTILVGDNEDPDEKLLQRPDHRCENLASATEWILGPSASTV